MKRKTKGLIAAAFFGVILVTSTVALSLPNLLPGLVPQPEETTTVTGTPADNFPDEQRLQFCGTGQAKSNTFVKELKIPTECTQPLAIITDPDGMVWFAQTNTGKIAKYDPITNSFTEFENPSWPKGSRSMMWGMDYSSDGSIWYTDEFFDSVWKFSIEDEKYSRLTYPSEGESLPQKLQVIGSQVVVNDFTGGKITFFDAAAQTGDELRYLSLPSPVENSVTGDFAIDSKNNLWYTNWIFNQGGILIKFDQEKSKSAVPTGEIIPLNETTQIFSFPPTLSTPNGLKVDFNDKIWIADTSSSFFFKFDPQTESFTKYITSPPPIVSYGNSSGLIKTPISRPYWISIDDLGQIIFNEQTANRLAVFDPNAETLVEYLIPSKNPKWADCEGLDDCGLAQIFGFTINGEKIWFTEWVENNIGYIDTSIKLPLELAVDKSNLTLKKGQSETVTLQISSNYRGNVSFITASTATFSDLKVIPEFTDLSHSIEIPITITASENALATTHKVLLGAQTNEVTISKYITVTIQP